MALPFSHRRECVPLMCVLPSSKPCLSFWLLLDVIIHMFHDYIHGFQLFYFASSFISLLGYSIASQH